MYRELRGSRKDQRLCCTEASWCGLPSDSRSAEIWDMMLLMRAWMLPGEAGAVNSVGEYVLLGAAAGKASVSRASTTYACC